MDKGRLMPIFAAALVYWTRVLRQPIVPRLKRRHLGAFLIALLGVVLVRLWIEQRQPRPLDGPFWGEVAGVVAVYLLSWSLVLAVRARMLEPWFGGLDRMYLWHRRTAVVGFVLLLPHKVLSRPASGQALSPLGNVLGVVALIGLVLLVVVSLPRVGRLIRLPYERWLLVHRATGLFVAVAVAHGALVDPMLRASPLLQRSYVVTGVIGLLAYVYQEIVARFVTRPAGYTVARVERLTADTLDITLTPVGPPLSVRPGQFLFLGFGGDNAWQRHPFSVAEVAPGGTALRLSIRALGDGTRALYQQLQVGVPAEVTGAYGMFDYTLGGPRQIWIAAGIGIVPFLSWLRQPEGLPGRSVDLFYSAHTVADAPYLDEIRAAATRLPDVQVHIVLTGDQGRLTIEQVRDAVGGRVDGSHVFLCGPMAMTESFSRALRKLGVPRDMIHFEHFKFR